jgi:hypothetical protein
VTARSAAPFILFAAIGGIVAAILGWGYWHVSTHADVHVSLWDVALKTDRQLYGSLVAADVLFRDEAGTELAAARADHPTGLVSIIHPAVGDCRQEERAGGDAWRQCYETHSRWISRWARHARTARVTFGMCTIDSLPVEVEESRGDWWLWWVPTPHIDNSASTHVELAVWIDSAQCRAAEPVR